MRDYTLALQSPSPAQATTRARLDGVCGPTTVDAVKALPKAKAKATDAALLTDLQAKGGAAA